MKYVRRRFKCDAREAKGHMPKARLPASLPRSFRFNETVGIDLVEVADPWGDKHIFLNMVCWGTLLQLFERVELNKASVVGNMFQESWIQYFGSPVTVIVDLGTEFTGTDFQDRCDRNGVFVHFCDSKAPWQNDRTERHGGMMKPIIEKATYEFCPADVE